MSFRGRVFTASLSYPSEAGIFMAKSVSGGAYTTAQKRALGYLVSGLGELGIGAPGSNWFIYPFIGNTTEKNALNLFYPHITEYNLTFIGSPTQSSAGTSFNGTTQYAIGPSLALYPLTPNLSMSNVSYGICTTGIGAGTYIPIGYFSSASVQTKTYSTAGSFTFNPNSEAPGITAFTITAFGGGGAGGGANGTTNFAGGGGAGGGYATRAVTLTNAQGATSINITVGVGGTANSAASGGTGGDSIVTHPNFTGINGKGGTGGKVNTAAAGALTTAPTTNSGTTVFNGGTGAAGGTNAGRGGGGGGSSAGTAANGGAGSTPTNTNGGAGGTAPTGGVAGGAGGAATIAGITGTAGGGAGGGAGSATAGNPRAGGAGGAGKVTISWSPGTFKRDTLSIFNTGAQQLDCSVDSDNTSRFQLITTAQLNGVRVGSRRGNTGTAADMGYYINNNAASAVMGPAVMSTTSYNPSPNWYIGAGNSTIAGLGNTAVNFYSGVLNFAFIGPGLTNGQLQAMYTLITTYNTILGR
jgi:hypothetical protein